MTRARFVAALFPVSKKPRQSNRPHAVQRLKKTHLIALDEIRDSLGGDERLTGPAKVVEHHRRRGVCGVFRLGIPLGPARVGNGRDALFTHKKPTSEYDRSSCEG